MAKTVSTIVTMMMLFCSFAAVLVVAQTATNCGNEELGCTLETWTKSECDCAYGEIGPFAGRHPFFCDCKCQSEFVRPNCLYSGEEYIPIQIILNETVEGRFNGGRFERQVRVGMGYSETYEDIWLRVREENTTKWSQANPGKIIVQVTVLGTLADGLVMDVLEKKLWTQNMGNTGIFLTHARVLPIEASAGRLFTTKVYESEMVTIYLDDIGWLIGVICICFIPCTVERIVFTATKSKSEEVRKNQIAEREQNMAANNEFQKKQQQQHQDDHLYNVGGQQETTHPNPLDHPPHHNDNNQQHLHESVEETTSPTAEMEGGGGGGSYAAQGVVLEKEQPPTIDNDNGGGNTEENFEAENDQ